MAAPNTLALFWLWGRIDNKMSASYLAKYKPKPKPAQPRYTAARDLIIVTTDAQKAHVAALIDQANLTRDPDDSVRVELLSTPELGKRAQLVPAIRAARGSIIAMSDDHILWPPTFLEHMLPCFEDAQVGAAGPNIDVHIPPEPRDDQVVTPWEAAATRIASRRGPRMKADWAAAQWCWVIAGGSGVYRAEILKDGRFVEGYLNDYWCGRYKLDVGEDTFISRWLQRGGWKIAIQTVPETDVLRTAKRTSSFVTQMFRWERSTIQSFLRSTFEVPQIWRNFYVARKTVERIVRPILTITHIAAWVMSMYSYPRSTTALILYYIWESAPGYAAFIGQYPFMWRQLWAIVLVDYFFVVQDIWCWATLNDTHWEARDIPEGK